MPATRMRSATTTMEARQRMLTGTRVVRLRHNMALPIPSLIALEVVELLRSTSRQRPVVPMVRVVPVVHMPMEPVGPMEPRPRS
jgi:hypothetical protein